MQGYDNNKSNSDRSNFKKSVSLFHVLLASVVIIGCSLWGFSYYTKKIISHHTAEKKSWKKQNETIYEELQILKKGYNRINAENLALKEQLSSKEYNPEEVDRYIKENETLKQKTIALKKLVNNNKSSSDPSLKTEVTTLSKKIQSLETELKQAKLKNENLSNKNKMVAEKLSNTQSNLKKVEKDKAKVVSKLKKAEKLIIDDLTCAGIKYKSENNYKIKDKLKQCDKIMVCFSINENPIAKAGEKKIGVRITDANQTILPNNSLIANNDSISLSDYSIEKQINYNKKEELVCMYYNIENTIGTAGEFKIEVHINNNFKSQETLILN